MLTLKRASKHREARRQRRPPSPINKNLFVWRSARAFNIAVASRPRPPFGRRDPLDYNCKTPRPNRRGFFRKLPWGNRMNEKRSAPRLRTLKGGTISLGGGGAIDCTIRNLTSTGANLEVASPVGIPDDLTLVIRSDQSQHSCRVVCRKQNRIGVAFK
jgi:hypothetical protein